VQKDRANFSVWLEPAEGTIGENKLLLALGDEPETVPARVGGSYGQLPNRGLSVCVEATISDRLHVLWVNATNKNSHHASPKSGCAAPGVIPPSKGARCSPVSAMSINGA
jgi:hypothetical protein